MRTLALATLVIALLVSHSAASESVFAIAATGSPDEVAALLTAAEVDLEVTDEHGYTPLMLAVRHNGPEAIAAFLDAGADPCATNRLSGVGLFSMVWKNPYSADIVALLRDRGVFPAVVGGTSSVTACGVSRARASSPPTSTPSSRSPSTPSSYSPRSSSYASPSYRSTSVPSYRSTSSPSVTCYTSSTSTSSSVTCYGPGMSTTRTTCYMSPSGRVSCY